VRQKYKYRYEDKNEFLPLEYTWNNKTRDFLL